MDTTERLHLLTRLVLAFLPRSKHLLISWLQSPSAVILEPKKIKSLTVSIVSPSICCEVMGPDTVILAFSVLSFKPSFSLSSFTFRGFFSSSLLSAVRVVSSAYLRLLIFVLVFLKHLHIYSSTINNIVMPLFSKQYYPITLVMQHFF